MSVAQVGLEPTASLVLSQGGLPIAYRAVPIADCRFWIADLRLVPNLKSEIENPKS